MCCRRPHDGGWVEAGQPGHDLFQVLLVYFVERVVLVAIHVEDGNELPGLTKDGHHNFTFGIGITGDMSGELVNVRHNERLLAAGARTAHTPVEGDVQAAQRALVRPNEQPVWSYPPVEAGPRISIKGLMQQSDHSDHCDQKVRLARQGGLDLLHHPFVGGSFLLAVHAIPSA
jgi:hypothetical protein